MRVRSTFALIVICLLAVEGRMLFESHQEFGRAEREEKQGRIREAVIHYDRAAHAYAPGNPKVSRSLEALWRIGQSQEENDPRLALFAYDSLRGSVYSSRNIFWPNKEWLPRVNERIARLRAKEQIALESGLSYEAALAFHSKALLTDSRPIIGWVLVVQLGFWGWIASTFGLIWKGFSPEGKMALRPSIPWILGMISGFSIWIIGLFRA